MILKGIKYLLFSIYKIASINYGKEGGAYASFVIVTILMTINAIAIFGFFNKIFFANLNISLIQLSLMFSVLLIVNYFLLIHNGKYKSIISNYTKKKNRVAGALGILLYVVVSFTLLVMVILIKNG